MSNMTRMRSIGSTESFESRVGSISSMLKGQGVDLVASLSEEARGPLDEVNRKWHVAGLGICACLSLVWGIHDMLDDCEGCRDLGATRAVASALILGVGVAMAVMQVSARSSDMVVTMGVVAWSTTLMWGFVTIPAEEMPAVSRSLALQIMAIYVLFASLPAWSCGLFLMTHAMNSAALFWLKGVTVGYTELLVCSVYAVCVAVYVYYRQEGYRAIRHILEAEQEASKALVSMFCDAAFWMGPDGDTIVRGDWRLDVILNTTMEGQRLSESFKEEERNRFQDAIKQSPMIPTYSNSTPSSRMAPRMSARSNNPSTASSRTASPAKLLHVTLHRWDGFEVKASLLIVAAGSNLGYMVGLRLDNSLEASLADAPRTPGALRRGVSGSCGNGRSMSSEPSASVHASSTQVHASSTQPPATTPQTSDVTVGSRDPQGICYVSGRDANLDAEVEGERAVTWKSPRSRSTASANASAHNSYPATLVSAKAKEIEIQSVGKVLFNVSLHRLAASRAPSLRKVLEDTLRAGVDLLCDHAEGGALVVIAPEANFKRVFANLDGAGSPIGRRSRPMLRTCDGGYMTNRLKGLHVSDARLKEAFRDFTAHSSSDRWPESHPDAEARGQPKDGALLLDVSGYRLACAVKLTGLVAPANWPRVGTRHETALACAWAVEGCVVLVRSDSGKIHGLAGSGAGPPRVFSLVPEDGDNEEVSFVAPMTL